MRVAIFAAIAFLFCASAWADDLSYVGDEELGQEIEAREADVARTNERLDYLEAKRAIAVDNLDGARMDVLEADRALSTNAGLLYRLAHHGRGFKYLLSSDSPTAFMKRLHNLRRLVIVAMEERRESGLRLTEAEAELESIDEEISGAKEMLERLVRMVEELTSERARREQELLATALP